MSDWCTSAFKPIILCIHEINEVKLSDLEQKVSESDEGGPVIRFGAPALQHDVVDVLRTVVRFTQPLSLNINLVEDLQMGINFSEIPKQIHSFSS